MLINMQRFEAGHRVWGHNFLVISLTALLLGWTQARFGWIECMGRRFYRGSFSAEQVPTIAKSGVSKIATFSLIAFLAQAVHLPCDMVVSGGTGLSDWLVRPLWPFSDLGFVWALIPWGDVGPTVILMAGAIGIAKRPDRSASLASITLLVLCAYLGVRGWSRGAFIL